MTIHNKTHLYMEQVSVDKVSEGGGVGMGGGVGWATAHCDSWVLIGLQAMVYELVYHVPQIWRVHVLVFFAMFVVDFECFLWVFLITSYFNRALWIWHYDSYNQLGGTCLAGYVPSRIQHALMKKLLTLISLAPFRSLALTFKKVSPFQLQLNETHKKIAKQEQDFGFWASCLYGEEREAYVFFVGKLLLETASVDGAI